MPRSAIQTRHITPYQASMVATIVCKGPRIIRDDVARGDEAFSGSDAVRLSTFQGARMPTERLAMRHVRECDQIEVGGMPTREIARRVGTAPSTVRLTFEAGG
jgi:hypothetical protein